MRRRGRALHRRYGTTTTPPRGFDEALARLRTWNPFGHHTYEELQQHEADLQLLPDDSGSAGPVWRVR